MTSDVPSTKAHEDNNFMPISEKQNNKAEGAILVPDNARPFHGSSLEMQDLSEQLNGMANRLETSHKTSRFHILGWVMILIFCPLLLVNISSHMPDEWKLEAVKLIMKAESSWEAGRTILEKSDRDKMEEVSTAHLIVTDNIEKLERCIGLSRAVERPVECTVLINAKKIRESSK